MDWEIRKKRKLNGYLSIYLSTDRQTEALRERGKLTDIDK